MADVIMKVLECTHEGVLSMGREEVIKFSDPRTKIPLFNLYNGPRSRLRFYNLKEFEYDRFRCVGLVGRVTMVRNCLRVFVSPWYGSSGEVVGVFFFNPCCYECYLHLTGEVMSDFLKKLMESSPDTTEGVIFNDPPAIKRWPCLMEFLFSWVVEGKSRETGSLMIFTDKGEIKLCLSDKETNRQAWHNTSGTFLGALDGLEKRLSGFSLDWRVPRSQEVKGKGRKGG
jgi:hypothetical protein